MLKEFSNISYIAGCAIFIPTRKRVTTGYENGNVGDQLWFQCIDGVINGNLFTLNEIMVYNPSEYNLIM